MQKQPFFYSYPSLHTVSKHRINIYYFISGLVLNSDDRPACQLGKTNEVFSRIISRPNCLINTKNILYSWPRNNKRKNPFTLIKLFNDASF